jgi:hypothetical protein
MCVYIKEWFKTNFLLFIILLLRKLMLLVTLVDFAPPPRPIFLAKLRLYMKRSGY